MAKSRASRNFLKMFRSLPTWQCCTGIVLPFFALLGVACAEVSSEAVRDEKPQSNSKECSPLKSGSSIKSGFGKVLVSLPKPVCIDASAPKEKDGISFGDYYLENNAWNSHRSTWKWKQCVELRQSSDGIKYPNWSYDWGDENSIQEGFYEWEVRSFPRVIYGLREDNNLEDSCKTSGLPSRYSKLPKFEIDYAVSSTQTERRKGHRRVENFLPIPTTGGDRNLIVEAKFFEDCTPGIKQDDYPLLRIMVWLENGPERKPAQHPEGSIFTDSAGRKFKVFTKVTYGDDSYIAFTALKNMPKGKMIFNEFVDYVRLNSKRLNLVPFSDEWCVSNFSFGTEIWWGEGTVSFEKLDITRTY